MKRKILKILLVAVSVATILAATIVPSFAWSIDYSDGRIAVTPDVFNIDFETDGNSVDGNYFYLGVATQLIYPYDGMQWKDTLIRIELFTYNNTSSATCYVTPTGSTDRTWRYSVRGPVRDVGDTSSTMADLEIAIYLSDGRLSFDLYSSVLSDFRGVITLEPDAEYIRRNYSSQISGVISGLNSQIASLTNEVNSLTSQNEELRAENAALENNNILDGALSGIGGGFGAFISPLLDIGVGGVTVGTICAVLLFIGLIMLFVFIFQKIRGG